MNSRHFMKTWNFEDNPYDHKTNLNKKLEAKFKAKFNSCEAACGTYICISRAPFSIVLLSSSPYTHR